jgi:chitodextrinase
VDVTPRGADDAPRGEEMTRRSGSLAVLVVVALGGCGVESPVAATQAALTDCAPATAAWTAGRAYAVGARVAYEGRSYQALVAHTALPGWEPTRTPSLWAQPTPCAEAPWSAQTLYVVGSRVTFAGTVYQCRQAHESLTGWEPPATPALWSAVGPAGSRCPGACSGHGSCDENNAVCLCALGFTGDACDGCADGFGRNAAGGCALIHDGSASVWPNAVSRASSDPWLAVHHDEVALVRPNLLVLLYANPGSYDGETELVRQIISGLAEGSRSRGYANPNAPAQLQYQPRFVDLRDGVGGRPQPPQGYPYENSTLLPRKPAGSPGWGVDYARFFAADYARYLGYPDPARPGQFRDLCALVDDGTVHEVWFVGSGDVPDANAAEVLGMMPNYTATGNRVPDSVNRCAGNGCFDPEVPYCGRSLRIGFVNYNRGPGCYLHSNGHGIEFGVKDSVRPIQDWFLSFAGFDLDGRYGLPFNNLYQLGCAAPPCIEFPTPTHARFQTFGDRIDVDPFDAVCGNVHFPPNGTSHYDYFDPLPVLSSCEGFGRHAGAGGADAPALVDPSRWAQNSAWGDCGGEFLVWWYQNMPGHASGQRFSDGSPMKSMWPALFY